MDLSKITSHTIYINVLDFEGKEVIVEHSVLDRSLHFICANCKKEFGAVFEYELNMAGDLRDQIMGKLRPLIKKHACFTKQLKDGEKFRKIRIGGN